MKKPPSDKQGQDTLRQRAEEELKTRTVKRSGLSPRDMKHLIHELDTHQIELEMQNEELRSTQSDLDTSRRRYADLFDFAPIPYITLNAKGTILEMNFAGTNLLGLPKRKILNIPFSHFVVAGEAAAIQEELDRFFNHLAEALQKRTRIVCELALKRSDGTHIIAQLQSIAAAWSEEPEDCVLTAIVDLTEQRRSEARTRHLASFPQLNPNPVIEVDASGAVVFLNPATEGCLASAGLVKADARLFFPSDMKTILEQLRNRKSAPLYREVSVGNMTFAENLHLAPQYGTVRIYAHEITGLRQVERALRESEERFRTLTESSPDCIALHDRDLRHLYVNPSISRLVGLPLEDFVGKTVHETGMPMELAEQLEGLLKETRETRRELVGEIEVPTPDGTRYFQWRSVPLFTQDNDVSAIMAVAADITGRKMAGEKIRQHVEELEAANEALERFNLAAVDRELRMVELKKEMNELLRQAGQPPRFPLNFVEGPE